MGCWHLRTPLGSNCCHRVEAEYQNSSFGLVVVLVRLLEHVAIIMKRAMVCIGTFQPRPTTTSAYLSSIAIDHQSFSSSRSPVNVVPQHSHQSGSRILLITRRHLTFQYGRRRTVIDLHRASRQAWMNHTATSLVDNETRETYETFEAC